jgi:hypothetical protein
MKKIGFALVLVFQLACNGERTFRKAEDAQDAGREFVRASLDGDYEKANFYLLQDSTNQLLMKKWHKDLDQQDPATKKKYKDADILVINFHPTNDSAAQFTYSNSYKKDTSTLRIVRANGEWLVDLKEIMNFKN